MVTLTYRPGEVYGPRDVSQFVDHLRKWSGRRGFVLRGVWVLELQRRGAPHYHLVVWLPAGVCMPKPDKQGWWKKGSTRVEWARRPVGYLVKYSSKGLDGAEHLPKGARIWGAFGRDRDARDEIRWFRAPQWLRQLFEGGEGSCQGRVYRQCRKEGVWWRVGDGRYRGPWRLVNWTSSLLTLVNIGVIEWAPVSA